MKRWIWACGVALVLAAGCGRKELPAVSAEALDPASFDATNAFREVKRFVGLGSKDSGTPGAANAAFYLQSRLRAMGAEAEIDEFVDESPKGAIKFRNVIGRIPGPGDGVIILGGHYDTKSGMKKGFEGANDGGSSTGILLELARLTTEACRAGAITRTVMIVFFDGEECMVHYGPQDGLHGSRHMANRLLKESRARDVKAVIVLDMVGDRDLTVTLPMNSTPFLVSSLFDAAHAENTRGRFSLYPFEVGDDHDPFLKAGIPAIDILDFRYGSARDLNDYWHTEEDRMDKISADSLGVVGRVTLRMLNDLLKDPVAGKGSTRPPPAR